MPSNDDKKAAIQAVLDYVSNPLKKRPLAAAEDIGVDGGLLCDLWLDGYLWTATREDQQLVFGVSIKGRAFLHEDRLSRPQPEEENTHG